ncbi:long-chain-fatty-acid--CoA ligase ACSBG2 isoform X3 [Lingula anatina]|nr:long-chain-fatty-acid--CoA ligase ACSBG2 isoform X3 [Lingula anatina]|eukprot:XP_013385720.1 long-chain-fatty-acid--CoA ligase ACSBG2 isoform X3 [Lingula anatina]
MSKNNNYGDNGAYIERDKSKLTNGVKEEESDPPLTNGHSDSQSQDGPVMNGINGEGDEENGAIDGHDKEKEEAKTNEQNTSPPEEEKKVVEEAKITVQTPPVSSGEPTAGDNQPKVTYSATSTPKTGGDPGDGLIYGMDELAPADSFRVWQRDAAVKLQVGEEASEKPLTIMSAFVDVVKRIPNNTALATKEGEEWKTWSYRQYYDDVKRAAKSFIKLGLDSFGGVGILGFNSPEWLISNLGTIFAGGLATGIYATNSPEACEYIISNSKTNVVVVENNVQLQKILKIWDKVPHLKAVVQYKDEVAERRPNVYSWQEFMDLGKETADSVLVERIKAQRPNQCCTLIYTSGTTGNPKGVMLSHDNYTWLSRKIVGATRLKFGQEVLVSYLPLSHVAAQIVDIYGPLIAGAAVYFARPDALKGTLRITLNEVHPTVFFGVPRVWEKIQEGLKELGKQTTGIKKKVATWAKGVGYKGSMSLMNGGGTPFGWSLANLLLFRKVRTGLGLDRCSVCSCGAAPVMKETLDFFLGVNIPIMETYGMSESTGPHTISVPWRYRLTSVGFNVPGTKTDILNPDEDGCGEVCMRGRHVFMGYLDTEEKTCEALDADGLLHSGDIGKIDKDGFIYITGRIKELIITAGGENVAPVPIEDTVKEELPGISNVMLVGDKRKFLSMLLTMKVEVDDNGAPTDKLSKVATDWCRSLGSSASTVSDILDNNDAKVLKAIQEGIDRANAKSTSRAQKVQKWSLLAKDFSIPGGELGPTLKLKRPVVSKMYKNTIDKFYEE